jgi:hypothetical protein
MKKTMLMVAMTTWVLWAATDFSGDRPKQWNLMANYDSKEQCQEALESWLNRTIVKDSKLHPENYNLFADGYSLKDKDGNVVTTLTYHCLSDTINPRTPSK